MYFARPSLTMALSYLTEPKPLTINLLTNYTDVIHWFLIFASATRLASPLPSEFCLFTRLPGFAKSFGFISFADPHPLTPVESYRFENSGGEGGEGRTVAPFLPKGTPPLSFHALTEMHFATLLFSDSCRNGGGGYPSHSLTDVALTDFNSQLLAFDLRLVPSPLRVPLLFTTSHQSPVTSHLQ
jgi:hypothetical protein